MVEVKEGGKSNSKEIEEEDEKDLLKERQHNGGGLLRVGKRVSFR